MNATVSVVIALVAFPAVRRLRTTARSPFAKPGKSDVETYAVAASATPRPVWQYPHDASQPCRNAQSGHRNVSHPPRRAAKSSHCAAGATLRHPWSARSSPAAGRRVRCVTPPIATLVIAAKTEEE